ncbi:MAG: trypsin-like peptidase domain-containing protein [Bacteroidetes bacterium]|nr:trypsin-like peptidase domain-containing protein [Bacteroidota bacterium]
MKKIILLLTVTVILSGCAAIFIPKMQKVTFTTDNKDAKIYVDKEEMGKGKSVTQKIQKNGAKQILIKTPGFKDTYQAMVQTKRPIAYWCLQPLNLLSLYYGFWIDSYVPKNLIYDNVVKIPIDYKLVTRGENDKYVDISNIKLNIKNKDKDIKEYYLPYASQDFLSKIESTEKNANDKSDKADAKELKKKNSKNKLEDDDEKKIMYEDTKFTTNVYKTLKNTGFVDTVNTLFYDNNNTLTLEGSINKIYVYTIYGKKHMGYYYKTKMFLTWYVENSYGEILDSIETKEYSGDFTKEKESDSFEKMFGDAVDISYLNLHKNSKFTKYLKQETNFACTDVPLTLTPIPTKSVINDKSDASIASVIIKSKEGHGSGFAITQDGYILTNFHVISGKYFNKLKDIKVIASDGEELKGTIVRYNRYRDIALIKVDKKFEKVFKLTTTKSFKNLQEVFTIGAPKSVELGQSVSTGVISNERKNNNNNLLQLNMSINAGNSGGPLFDAQGTVHGIVNSKLVGKNTEGVSFAIPGYLIQEYLNINYK